MSLQIVITDAGRAEIVNAENNGTAPVTISEIGFGSGQYTASAAQTVLQNEFKRLNTISGAAVGDDTIHVSARDESADDYQVYEFGLYLASGTLFAVYSQNTSIIDKTTVSIALLAVDIVLQSINPASVTFGDANFINPPATTESEGVVELATNAETQAGTDNQKAVTPAGLASRTSTTTRSGLVELATSAETQAGTDSNRAVTPSSLASLTATESRKGLIEVATNSETQSGTDNTRAVTPAGLESRTQASETDNQTNKILKVGAFGVGKPVPVSDLTQNIKPGMYTGVLEVVNGAPISANIAATFIVGETYNGHSIWVVTQSSSPNRRIWNGIRETKTGELDWVELTHEGNIQALVDNLVPQASTTTQGRVELATNTETQAGSDSSRAVTPASLASRTATETRAGLVELATNSETQSGSDSSRAVTPASLASRTATTNRTGLVELATDSESESGSSSGLASTPSGVHAAFNQFGLGASKPLPNLDFNTDIKPGLYTGVLESLNGAPESLNIASSIIVNETYNGHSFFVITQNPSSSRRIWSGTRSAKTGALDWTELTHEGNIQALIDSLVPQASATTKGKVELATNTETQTGTDSSRAVTPAGLKSWSDDRGVYGEDNNEMVGSVAYFITTVAPDGWIKANGAAVSRTTYSKLFAKVGTFWGPGNGSTTFNLPDLRGEFIRCWDDGRGVDSARAFGTYQADEFKSHSHNIFHYNESNNTGSNLAGATGVSTQTWQTEPNGGTETRPRNVALVAYIKY